MTQFAPGIVVKNRSRLWRVDAQVGADDNGLVVGVADDAQTDAAAKPRQFHFEFRSERRVGDVVN